MASSRLSGSNLPLHRVSASTFLFCVVAAGASAQSTNLAKPALTPSVSAPLGASPTYVRQGAPITFSGRVLPADATGTLSFVIDGAPAQTVPLSTQTLGDYVSLGDSITSAGYIADPNQRYPGLVAHALGLNLTNWAAPGYTACQVMPLEILPNDVGVKTATSPLYSLLIGTNDLDLYGTGPHEAVFNTCHQAALAWLAVAPSHKFLVGSPAVSIQSGPWTSTAITSSVATLANTSGSGSIRFTVITTGAPAYLWYGSQAAPGSFTVSVDGAAPSSPVQTQFAGPLPSNITTAVALLRLPVPAGAHTFDISAQSGTVSILAMGSPATSLGPTVLAADIPSQALTNSTLSTAAGIAAYTADIQANINLLHADGLDLRFVATQNTMFGSPAEMMDAIHPNAVGLAEVAQAFAAAVTPAAPVRDTISAATGSFTTSALTVGTHGIDILYSGDSKYLPADSGTFAESIYDGSSTTTLVADAAIYPIQSAIALTATVAQPNASGLVTFSDQSGPIGSAWLNAVTPGQAQLSLASLPAGSHTITAQYQGDAQYNASISAAVAINVSGSYTITSLTAPATRYYATAPIPLTARVTPTSATGTVTFADGATILGLASLNSGSATFTAASLATGIHQLTATFNGNATQNPSESPALAIQIDPNSTVVSLSPIPATIAYGTPLPLLAAVSPALATGTVTFSDGASALGRSALTNGSATITPATLSLGNHTFTATYCGDANDLPSISTAVSTQVTLVTSTISLAPIPPSETFGTTITLAASVVPASASGTVTFNDGGNQLAQFPVANGAAFFAASALSPGPHTFTATYSGDTYRTPATSPGVSTTITQIQSGIAPPPPHLNAGTPLTLTATLSPASATGTVLFRDANLGVLGISNLSSGTASLTLANPSIGLYSVTAVYSGDVDDTPATSASVSTQIAVSTTTTSLTTSASTAAFNAPITLTAAIAPASVTGSITFFDGATPLATILITNGTATLATTALTVGSHTLHATYSGDALNASSTSATGNVTITLDSTITTLTLAQNPVSAAANIIANVRITSSNTNPSGTVTLRSGSTVLASGPASNASGNSAYATLSLPAAVLGVGSFPLFATYSGDPQNQPSDTAATPVSVAVTTIPTTVTLTVSASQIPIQGTATLTAAVNASTGSVAFVSGSTTLATAPLSAAGIATYTFTGSTLGSLAITASYIPLGFYAASAAAPQTLLVTEPIAAAINPNTVSIAAGSSANATLTLTPLSGFTGPIQATCKVPALFVTCSLIVPTALNAQSTVPIKISIAQTTARSLLPMGTISLALLLPFLARRGRCRIPRLAALFLAAISLTACAEGGNFLNVPPGVETVTVTITAAGRSIPTTLTVNITD